jgi:TatD DNase family protein
MFFDVHTHKKNQIGVSIIQHYNTICTNYFSFGFHPNKSEKFNLDSTIPDLLLHPNCFAVGEIGLDKTISIPMEIQQLAFEQQIRWSEELELPVILHCVRAWNEVARIHNQLQPKQPWIFHGFRKTSLLAAVLNHGLFVSIGTAVLWDEKLQETVASIPLESLFLETDTDEINQIDAVYACVSKLKSIPLPELERQLFENFKKTFRKWEIG